MLHAATGPVSALLFIVETDEGKQLYIGPAFSYYEVIESGFPPVRLNDEEWRSRLAWAPYPGRHGPARSALRSTYCRLRCDCPDGKSRKKSHQQTNTEGMTRQDRSFFTSQPHCPSPAADAASARPWPQRWPSRAPVAVADLIWHRLNEAPRHWPRWACVAGYSGGRDQADQVLPHGRYRDRRWGRLDVAVNNAGIANRSRARI